MNSADKEESGPVGIGAPGALEDSRIAPARQPEYDRPTILAKGENRRDPLLRRNDRAVRPNTHVAS